MNEAPRSVDVAAVSGHAPGAASGVRLIHAVPRPPSRHTFDPTWMCYACNIGIEGNFQNDSIRLGRFCLYEKFVEHIESLPKGAEIRRPWLAREFGSGPDNWNVSYLVVRDMALHGILHPLRIRLNGNIHAYRKAL